MRDTEKIVCKQTDHERQPDLVLFNENQETFESVLSLNGTSPGWNTMKLLEEVAECKTFLNDIPDDDIFADKKIGMNLLELRE